MALDFWISTACYNDILKGNLFTYHNLYSQNNRIEKVSVDRIILLDPNPYKMIF